MTGHALDPNRAIAAARHDVPVLRHRHDQLRGGGDMDADAEDVLARRALHFDVDAVAILFDIHLQLFNLFRRRPALFNLDDDLAIRPRADLNRAIERREVQLRRAIHLKAALFTRDVPLRIHDDAGTRQGKESHDGGGREYRFHT